MPTSNAEELGLFLKCTVIGRGVFGPWSVGNVQALGANQIAAFSPKPHG